VGRVPIAVLGDSDSRSYRDRVDGVRRGGDFHPVTFQWTELLAALRPEEVDLGAFGAWGQRGVVARLRDRLGLAAKTPKKEDFLYNFALSGSTCSSLSRDWPWQARWATRFLEADPERWASGLVVIKVGVNDLGQISHLKTFARVELTPSVLATIDGCASSLDEVVHRIRAVSSVAILAVGIADDSSWPADEVPALTPTEVARIRSVLNRFDQEMVKVISGVEGAAFMDDRAWYYDNWPDRDPMGEPRTASVSLGGVIGVTNTRGDRPTNLLLQDGHAGTVANGLWLRGLIRPVNDSFGCGISPPLLSEIADRADPDRSIGLAPTSALPAVPPRIEVPWKELHLRAAELPFALGPIDAYDETGSPVWETATAFLESDDGGRVWLFGDGDRLRLMPGRHLPGRYQLVLRVRDRAANISERVIPLTIR
jgi:hypothetical protein